ncbi:MAG: ribonuclease [Desulfobacteraceae bacterium 4572_19]|nr:MAG: ribonuclease [Desulfobacteraceae bacterium 4572_19]
MTSKNLTKKSKSVIRKILINAIDAEECRIAIVAENKLEEFYVETEKREVTQGNIYKAIITRVEPSLQAVFVDYGADRHGFLQKQEIHSDYFLDNISGNRNLTKIIKRGQELIVQVTKDPIMKKGAMLTTFISLPGRHLVLMPGSDNKGVSRKIETEKERKRLKEILGGLKLSDGYGLIVRTAGENCTKTQLSNDLRYLMRIWKDINSKAIVANQPAPSLLYKESNLALRSIRDYLAPDVTEILIDDATVYKEVKKLVNIIAPKQNKIVKRYRGAKPIFTKYQLEKQITSIFDDRVDLKSGGSIVIEQTEALVTIDVNSGKATKKKTIEETAFHTNIEAAEETARQLRLRDLGGLIVIDFIDMKDMKHKSETEKTIKTYLKSDKARTKVGKISKFGLLEMSRQRVRPAITFGSFVTCKHCSGKGLIRSKESLGLIFLRKLSLETLQSETKTFKGVVPVDIADYLLNLKRSEIIEIEEKNKISIIIEGDSSMLPGETSIYSV